MRFKTFLLGFALITFGDTLAEAQQVKTDTGSPAGTAAASTTKPAPPPTIDIPAEDVEFLKWSNLSLQAKLLRTQADKISSDANDLFNLLKAKLCKALNVDPADYDGVIDPASGKVSLSRKQPPEPVPPQPKKEPPKQ